jgi:hypothetical protein
MWTCAHCIVQQTSAIAQSFCASRSSSSSSSISGSRKKHKGQPEMQKEREVQPEKHKGQPAMQQPLQSEKRKGELKRKMQPEQQPWQSEKRKRQSEKHHGEKHKGHRDMSFDQVLDALYAEALTIGPALAHWRIDSSPTRVEIVLELVVVVRCVLPLLPRRAWHRGVEHRRLL